MVPISDGQSSLLKNGFVFLDQEVVASSYLQNDNFVHSSPYLRGLVLSCEDIWREEPLAAQGENTAHLAVAKLKPTDNNKNRKKETIITMWQALIMPAFRSLRQ